MISSIFIIPKEFLFLLEVIKAFYYYISNYFFMYFETFVIKTYSFSRIDDGE